MLRFFQGIRPLRRAAVLRDAAAGVALAAMNIPQALGYTRIAGMPVVTGLYTLLLPLLAFATAGSSRYLVVAADSATAAILAGGLAGLAPVASPQYVALAGNVALLTAGFLLLGRLFKLGFIADFLSQTVLVGFLTGVGFQVGSAVLGDALGIEVHSRRTLIQLYEVATHLSSVQLPTLLVSASVLISVLVLRRVAPRVPGPLVAVVGATAASGFWKFSTHGIATIGPVTGGLPRFGLQLASFHDLPMLLPIAASCAVMIVTQSAATARVYAVRHGERLDENQDLVGLAAANTAAAFTGAFPVNGSPTQTAMVESAGGQSQMAHIATACVVACVLFFLSGPLQYLPRCVLGALVLLVAIHLVDIRGLLSMRRESPGEYAVAVATAAVVIIAGVEDGIVLAMIMSLLRIVHHSYHPHTGVMIAEPNKAWKIVPPAPGVVTQPGLVLYHFGAALFYANSGRFADEIRELAVPKSTIRWIIVDAEAITNIDYSASRVVAALKNDLADLDIAFGFARLQWQTKEDFDRHHLTGMIDASMCFNRLHDALDAYEKFVQARH
ncbi:MAG TPA: SulP family inorganic anion transporter [Terracidiphilus sp.]|nr:SulP family inorganic anion transporter [Terracidiphilus sp.]